jgi:DNA-directed RNA polymerase subunit RPC12/RpoP
MIRFKCIYCGQRILAKDDGIGKKGKCPKCLHMLIVPDSTKGRPAIDSDYEPVLDKAEKKYAIETGNTQKPVFDKEAIKEDINRLYDGQTTELFKEKFGFLVPTYDRISLFLMAVTWILIFMINNQLQEPIQAYFTTLNWKVAFIVLALPVFILTMGIYQVFLKREQSDFERTWLLWFAIATNVLTGIFASVYVIKNADVRNWQLIFPIWNIINAAVLYLMLVANIVDENCVIDRRPTPTHIFIGLAATFAIVLICNYVLRLHWAITFSICIVYTTSFDRALQSVFPRLATQDQQ